VTPSLAVFEAVYGKINASDIITFVNQKKEKKELLHKPPSK